MYILYCCRPYIDAKHFCYSWPIVSTFGNKFSHKKCTYVKKTRFIKIEMAITDVFNLIWLVWASSLVFTILKIDLPDWTELKHLRVPRRSNIKQCQFMGLHLLGPNTNVLLYSFKRSFVICSRFIEKG